MKIYGYIALFMAAACLCAACKEEEKFGEQNIGLEHPSVGITVDKVTTSGVSSGVSVSCTFSVSVSDGAGQYGYAVLQGSDPAAPDAYSILVGEVGGTVSSGTYFHTDGEGPVQHSFSAAVSDAEDFTDYTIYAAAITSTGLTSEVASVTVKAEDIPAPVPDFEVQRGQYTVSFTSGSDDGLQIESQDPGASFTMGLSPFEGIRDAADADAELYVLGGCWFNMAEVFGLSSGSTVPPYLLGKLDRENYTITFDRMVDPSSIASGRTSWTIHPDSPYETAFYNESVQDSPSYMLRGSGDGDSPVVITLNENGVAVSVSACAFARMETEPSRIVAYYDSMAADAELTFVP